MTPHPDDHTTQDAAGFIRQILGGQSIGSALAAMAEAELSIIMRRAPDRSGTAMRILLIVMGLSLGGALEAIRLARSGILCGHTVDPADGGPISGHTMARSTFQLEGGRA